MEKTTEKEIQEAIKNLQLEMMRVFEVENKIISQWKLKISINRVEIDLGDANAFVKTNWKYLTEVKEEALQSVESFLKRYFLQNAEELEKHTKEGLRNN